MRHLIDINDFSVQEINELITLAEDISVNPQNYSEMCKGKKLATLFFEPSTRTRLSFEAAMLELGGNVIGFSDSNSSSSAKGESVTDTVKMVSYYADIIAMRHHKEGAPKYAVSTSLIPIINAGDGGHSHPTQTLADLMTIKREKNEIKDLKIGFCGDLKFGRTVHSLLTALCNYQNIEFVFISPEELCLPDYIKKTALCGREFIETENLEEVIPALDILYMTRVQKERFFNEEDYIRLKDSFILTADKLKNASDSLSVMHPLPRVNEISVEIDNDKRACYFKQVENGKFIRKALILKLLEVI
ncbi:aspartate carbamoyltransferase [Eubacteriales bacterium OttesenSCG-928-G02]|nr:aspartate carbamoyltransferase [Eubacteriales bacterium OttesenSCG-928-G02]